MPLLLLALILPVAALATPFYQVTAVGPPGSTGTALSADGRTAGYAILPGSSVEAFANGLALPGGVSTMAFGVNRSGASAGVTYAADGAALATYWSATGAATTLAGPDSWATAINDNGAAAGSAGGTAAVFANGSTQTLAAGGSWSAAYGINSSGQVAGTRQSGGSFQAFGWDPLYGAYLLGTLGGASSYAHAISDAGDIAGSSLTSSGFLRAFLYTGGTMSSLGTLGGVHSGAYGVNSDGVTVGYSLLAGGESAAFVYWSGLMLDLNSLIDASSGWLLTEARAINDAGQIVGTGIYQGEQRAFLLDPARTIGTAPAPAPIPEPGTIVLVSSVLAFGLAARWKPPLARERAEAERRRSAGQAD